jgi:CRP/FNR family cyclic AMP-dependent transcriptional regulator
MDRAAAEAELLRHGWLAGMAPGFQTALLALARPVAFEAGEPVFHIGDEVGGIYGIAAGGIGILVATEGRLPRLAHVARRGIWFGHGPVLTGRRRTLGFRAMEPTAALHVPLAALSALSRGGIEAALGLGALATANMDISIATVSDLLIARADRRVAAILLRATGAAGGPPPADPDGYRLTQGDLAEMANASRQTANRCLRDFAARGWIRLGYQRIAVLNPAALAAFANAEEQG